MTMPKIRIHGANQTEVNIGDITLYFSYETCVAFHLAGAGYFVSENVWSRTTAKHISQMTGVSKDRRISKAEFTAKLDYILTAIEIHALADIHGAEFDLIGKTKEVRNA